MKIYNREAHKASAKDTKKDTGSMVSLWSLRLHSATVAVTLYDFSEIFISKKSDSFYQPGFCLRAGLVSRSVCGMG